ncbi:hypothetical protein K402DRAFT_462412 [Aulographum hederae CBS 113979]|uniref:SWR1-complex protein 4 n=1 Tax=Aulographum hederae CBS 113979 TaxID=1176131 RepID=A0A6G1H4S0_9PEZI|nr:hypothetical protein K402DRAFT_462412 [Aulographum hederae CBS 113979]
MASRKDVQDIMGLPAGSVPPVPVPKASKMQPPKHRKTGLNRELEALYGERLPPVSIVDSKKVYRSKLTRDGPAVKWSRNRFSNPARIDGLKLRHWRPKRIADDDATSDSEQDYSFAKYNIQVTGPQYNDEEYTKLLKDDDWSKEETDYLVETVKQYYQKWPVIHDRYEYIPSNAENLPSQTIDDTIDTENANPSQQTPMALAKARTMEQLKSRYYTVCRVSMELQTPGGVQNMNEAEFQLHDTLRSYNPDRETRRKELAASLLNRPIDEIKEEESLLVELQRIQIAQPRIEGEREAIRAALEVDTKPSAAGASASPPSSSQLQQLFNHLYQNERNKKRGGGGGRLSLAPGDILQSPVMGSANGTPITSGGRDSFGNNQKRNSIAANGTQEPIRRLTPRQEARFGITTHERIVSGISFRTDKLSKMRVAKSQTQTSKISAVLAELGVPDILTLPSDKVCASFEALIKSVLALVEARKALEKEKGELKVLTQMKIQKEGGGQGVNGTAGPGTDGAGDKKADSEPAANDELDADADADAEGDEDASEAVPEAEDDDMDADPDVEVDEDAEDDAEGEDEDEDVKEEMAADDNTEIESSRPRSSRSNQKRSASVLSALSGTSSRRQKR